MYCKFCGKKLKEKEFICSSCSGNVKRRVTKLKIILHVFSIFVLLILMIGMVNDEDYFSSLCFTICLILLIPVVAKFLYDKFKINRLIKYLLIIIIFLIGMISSSSYKKMTLEENNNDMVTTVYKNDDKELENETDKKEETVVDEKGSKKKVMKTNSDEYADVINKALKKATSDNEYWYYSDSHLHYPYIQISIKPRKEMTESEQIEQAKIVGNKLIDELKKYEYKSGNIFSYNYDMISIYFHYYMYGQMSRNGGPFMQFSIYDIKELNVDELVS